MGSLYRKTEWHCSTCDRRVSKKQIDACEASGHGIEARQSKMWTIKYYRNGRAYTEHTGTDKKGEAQATLKKREGDIVDGKPVTPQIGRLKFEDAAADLKADYTTNRKRSATVAERRVRLHLAPFFGGRKMAEISTPHIRQYIVKRQTELSVLVSKGKNGAEDVRRVASDAEINRELALLKRMFVLAMQGGKLLHRPHIPMLKEQNTRTGFFEPEQLASVLGHLPTELKPIIEFAYITGWRVASEVLPLEWRRVDFAAGEVRLDPHTTKNGKGRVFPMTVRLRRLLQGLKAENERLQKAGHITPNVFVREVAEGRGGEKKPRVIVSFGKAWKTAVRKAGCPGRIPHDLRRTAVRNLVRAGIPERVAMQMTGHLTRSVFERYNIVSEVDLRDAARRLDAAAAGVGF